MASRKQYKISLSPEAAFFADFLIEEGSLQRLSILVERLIMQEIRKRKISFRPSFPGEGGAENEGDKG